jgi:hypothetical protein
VEFIPKEEVLDEEVKIHRISGENPATALSALV